MAEEKLSSESPSWNIRMVVTDSGGKSQTKLKPYLHFTLGCTRKEMQTEVKKNFSVLTEFLEHKPLQLQAVGIEQLGPPDRLVWTVKLSLSKELRLMLSKLFDPIMCAEPNGLFLWELDGIREARMKSAHITIGSQEEDKQLALSLVGHTFIFGRMDYKEIGPYDPKLSWFLEK